MRTRQKALILLAGAWVLWAQVNFKNSDPAPWRTIEGYPTYDQCISMEEVLAKKAKEREAKTPGVWSDYQCLPDTSTRVRQKYKEGM